MPNPDSDRSEFDPLLDFSSEPGAAPSSPQPAAAIEDPPAIDTIAPLRERIDKLERSLDRATREVAALRSQVATLVRVSGDIEKRSTARYRIATAVVAVIFGVALAASLWNRVTTDPNPIVIRASAASPVQPPDAPAQAAAQPAPAPDSPPPAPEVPSPPVHEETAPAPKPIDYVGTVSIDASPGGEVFLNRQDAGHTPLRLVDLKAGAHLIWIERDGYRRWTKVVDVPAGRISRVFADLEPLATR